MEQIYIEGGLIVSALFVVLVAVVASGVKWRSDLEDEMRKI